MMLSTYFVGQVLDFNIGINLLIQIVSGATIYLGLSYITDKKYLISLVKEVKQLKK